MFESLAVAVKEAAGSDLGSCTDGELGEMAVELAGLRSMLDAFEARVASAFDARKGWAADGARSAAAWLARRTREPKAACGAQVRAGRAEAMMPEVIAAWQAGELCQAHVARLVRAHNARTAEAFGRDEAMLVGFARDLTYAQFDRAVGYWELAADPDGADESEMRRRGRRRFDLARSVDGMVAGSLLLDPVSGEIFLNEMQRLEKELFEDDWRAAREALGREPLAHELGRNGPQRRADALTAMALRSATMPNDGKAPKPLLTLVLGAPAFQHLCQLESGQVVAPAAVVPWLADAEVERVLFDGSPDRPLSVSYRRSFTGALRRLLQVRDQTCYFDGCDEPAYRCEVDHIQPWSEGGITAHWNGRLACGYHNRRRNQRPPPDDDDD